MESIQANEQKEKNMEMDFENILMKTLIKENGKMIIGMGLGKQFIAMATLIKVLLKMVHIMEKGNIFGINNHGKVRFILGNSKMEKSKDYVFNNTNVETNIQDNIKIVKMMDKQFIPI